MSPAVALAMLAAVCLLVAAAGWWRYGGPLNPLTIFAIDQGLLFTVFSGVVALFVDPFRQVNPGAAVQTSLLSIAYIVGAAAAFTGHAALARRAYEGLLRMLYLDSARYAGRFTPGRTLVVMAAAAAAMAALAIVGGGGLLWLTNSRVAYQLYRSGAGPFFSAYEWLLSFALLYVLWSLRPRLLGTAIAVSCFAALMFLSGSKGFVLLTLIIGVCYYHFLVRRISTPALVLAAPLLAAGAIGLLLVQGTAQDLIGTVLYFREYFAFSAAFLERFEEFGHTFGATSISGLWSYVPRGLVPSKPFVYGIIEILEVLLPGAAERGHTPGILPWTIGYLDFGVIGVFFSGYLSGLLRRVPFEHFLRHRASFFAFSLMVHFSFRQIWLFLPLPLVFVLALIQATFLRLVLVRSPSPSLAPG